LKSNDDLLPHSSTVELSKQITEAISHNLGDDG